MTEKIVAYKVFKNDMKCRDFQYEVGKEYEEKGNISPCNNGFHACEMPLDVFNYYPLIDHNGKMSKFAEVEQSGEIKTDGDKKASSKISIKEMLSFADLFKAEFELIKYKVSKSENLQATTGNYAHSSTTGNYAHSSTTGDEAISCSLGLGGKAKASKGWIVIVDWQEKEDGTYGIKKIYSAKVGQKIKGTKIEPETSYWFDDGQLKYEKENNNG